MSFTGLLNTIPILNSITCKLTPSPSPFRVEAQFLGVKDFPDPNYKHPDSHLCSIPPNANGFSNSSVLATEIDTGECFSLLDRICVNRGFDYSSTCRQIHGFLVKCGVLKDDGFVWNRLAVAYLRNVEFLNDARKLFDEMPKREIRTYAALIGALCRSEKWVDLFVVLEMMLNDGMLPDRFIAPTILKACSVRELAEVGKMVHGYVLRKGMEVDGFVLNGLIDMYAKCGNLRYSERVFDTMNGRDVVSWTALIVANMSYGLLDEAVNAFSRMELDGVEADLISWNAIISSFARNDYAESIFDRVKNSALFSCSNATASLLHLEISLITCLIAKINQQNQNPFSKQENRTGIFWVCSKFESSSLKSKIQPSSSKQSAGVSGFALITYSEKNYTMKLMKTHNPKW